ncbi:hypothetical protein HPB50_026464 [Hyalomma asiaticum]|uniref:Uncharacterized protein n=1 Tax=Hyalomma asiaticum TaxID=266040 RepID=A0ACB7T001_HYAAI|nr:hypothetical protein HPB50_026464 [Hyalomma asiaticum]
MRGSDAEVEELLQCALSFAKSFLEGSGLRFFGSIPQNQSSFCTDRFGLGGAPCNPSPLDEV